MSQHARRLTVSSRLSPGLLAVGSSLAMGVILGFIALRMPGMSGTQLVLLVSLGLVGLVGVLVGGVRQALLVFLALGIPIALAITPLENSSSAVHAGGAWGTLVLYPYDFPLMMLAALWAVDGLLGRRPFKASAVDVAALGFIVWSLASMANSVDLALSGFEVARTAKLYLLSLVVAGTVRNRQDLRVAIIALLGSLALPTLVSVLQHRGAMYSEVFESTGRVVGTLGWPNTLGAYVAVVMVFAFSLWMAGTGGRQRWLAWGIGIAGMIPLVLTSSRGAWIAFILAIGLSAILSYRFGWLTSGRIGQMALLGAGAGVVSLLLGQRLIQRLTETSLQQSQLVDRMALNEVAFNMVAAHPFLGVGTNTFVEVMRDYDVAWVTYLFPEPVHNVFLLVAAETGVVGLGLFLLLVAAAFVGALKGARSRDRLLSATSIGITSGLVVIVASNMVDVHLRTDAIFALFWLLIGMSRAVNAIEASTRAAEDPTSRAGEQVR
jgi:putative inorganic carbon (hco3(-)) transporter